MSRKPDDAALTAAEAIALIEKWWPGGRGDATRDGEDFVVMWIPLDASDPDTEINPEMIPQGRSPLGYRTALSRLSDRMGRLEDWRGR